MCGLRTDDPQPWHQEPADLKKQCTVVVTELVHPAHCGVDAEDVPGTQYLVTDDTSTHEPRCPGAVLKRAGAVALAPQPSDSPNDPLNWPRTRKLLHLALLAAFAGLCAAVCNVASGSAQDLMARELGEPAAAAASAGGGALFAASAAACFLLAPVPHLYGRKPVYVLCLVLCVVGFVLFATAGGAARAVLSQVCVGVAVAASEVLVQQSISDIFFRHQQDAAVSVYVLASSVGTYLGPLIADYMLDGTPAPVPQGQADGAQAGPGWRWVGWWAAVAAGILLVAFVVALEETYFDRDKYRRRAVPDAALSPTPRALEEGAVPLSDGCASCTVAARLSRATTRASLTGADEPAHGYRRRVALATRAGNVRGTGARQYARRLRSAARVYVFPPVVYAGVQWGAQSAWLTFYLTTLAEDWRGPPYSYSSAAVGRLHVACLAGAVVGCLYGGVVANRAVEGMVKRNTKRAEERVRRAAGMGDDAARMALGHVAVPAPAHRAPVRTGTMESRMSEVTLHEKDPSNEKTLPAPSPRLVVFEPETRLYMLLPTAILSPLGMFLFGVGTHRHWHWAASYAGLGFVGFGWGCAGDLSVSYLMAAYPRMVLEGMVGAAVVGNALAGAFAFACQRWLDAHGTLRTYLALGSLNLLVFLLTVPMVWKGKWCRRKTKRLYEEFLELRDGQGL